MSLRPALTKVHQAAVRKPAGGSGKGARTQPGTKKRPGAQLEQLETRRAKTPSERLPARDGVASGSRGKRSAREPIEDPDPHLYSDSEQEWSEIVEDADSEEGEGTTDEDAVDDDAVAEAKAKRLRNGKGKSGEKGKKEEPVFTRKEVEALLQKERAKHHLPATPTPPTRPPGDDALDVPAPGPSSRSIHELDKAAQSVLRLACQTWVKSEESKGRIVLTKKWRFFAQDRFHPSAIPCDGNAIEGT